MRLFVAVVPSSSVLSALAAAVSSLPAGVLRGPGSSPWSSPGSSPGGNSRLTTREQWHVTLAFLGSVPSSVLPSLRSRLGRAASRHSALSLSLAGGGAFPSRGRARVLWAGVRGDVPALRKLAWSVQAAARRAGVEVKEEKRFRPHVTLARFKEPCDAGPAEESLSSFAAPEWPVTSISLIESRLAQGPGGRAEYEPVETYDLGRG